MPNRYYFCNMKTKADIDQNIISKLTAYFISQPVLKVWLFGSVARGEETPESDIDLLVQFDPEAKIGLFKHAGMMLDLEELMKRAVDLVPDGCLFSWVKDTVEQDKILIYERETV